MKFDFDIGDGADIIELERPGRVVAIYIDSGGPSYKIRYFHEGSAKEVYFYADEIKKKGN